MTRIELASMILAFLNIIEETDDEMNDGVEVDISL